MHFFREFPGPLTGATGSTERTIPDVPLPSCFRLTYHQEACARQLLAQLLGPGMLRLPPLPLRKGPSMGSQQPAGHLPVPFLWASTPWCLRPSNCSKTSGSPGEGLPIAHSGPGTQTGLFFFLLAALTRKKGHTPECGVCPGTLVHMCMCGCGCELMLVCEQGRQVCLSSRFHLQIPRARGKGFFFSKTGQ